MLFARTMAAVVALLVCGAGAAPTTVRADSAVFATIGHAALLARIGAGDIWLLDVRTPEEYAAGHIARAVNIPHDQLANRSAELPADKRKEIAVYCRSGRRSQLALEWLKAQGYERLLHVEGDMLGWQAAGQPLQSGSQ
jgi:phage shock protein E